MDALSRQTDDSSSFSFPFVDVFPVTGAAVSTLGRLLGSETLSASDPQAARLDELQFDLGEGPCWDAMTTARPVLTPDVRTQSPRRWPAFARAIDADELGAIFAFPLVIGPLRIGAVDLYSKRPTELTPIQSRQASEMADAVSRQVLRQALMRIGSDGSEDKAVNAFSRRVIHQATGMVLSQLDVPIDDARLVIEGHAFASNRSMMDVATDIVNGELNFSVRSTGIEASE
ncbi:GAF domain-containing protein [Conyzicola lurida]|nr:GAF and ANTAR domain-containing protein [Conyzicola lurida]